MKTKHLLTATFSMGLIVLISNTRLAFAVVHTPQYNQGYTAACTDAKHGIEIWDNEGTLSDALDMKYGALQNNTQWMQGYRDDAICTHPNTIQYNEGFSIGCHDKQTGVMHIDQDTLGAIVPPNHGKDWTLGYYNSGLETSFCPEKR
jgi:hypothetical protein